MAWSGRSKIEVVNQKVEDLKPLIHKMESAIEKLSELNTSVSRMLAVHEERLTKQEEIDNVLFTKIDQLRDKMDVDHNSVLSRIHYREKDVEYSRFFGSYKCISITSRFKNHYIYIDTSQFISYTG